MNEFSWPWCAQCEHGVERVERKRDLFTGDVVYTVHCHGQSQRQVVRDLDMHDATLIWGD